MPTFSLRRWPETWSELLQKAELSTQVTPTDETTKDATTLLRMEKCFTWYIGREEVKRPVDTVR